MDEQREYKFNNLKSYLKLVQTFPKAPFPKAGQFICFNYFFHLNPLYKDRPDLKKYLDFFPLDLCIAVQPKKKSFMCINFHALPLKAREFLLKILKRTYPSQMENDRIRIPGLSYKKLFRMLKKIGVSVRKYIFQRVRQLRYVPGDQLEIALKFFAQTWYASNYRGIQSRYNKYRPKIPK